MTVWAVAVVVGGGLTLVLHEDARAKGPYVWQDGHGAGPSPGARRPRRQPLGEDRSCPPVPSADPAAASGRTAVVCLYATTAP
ncbi:hypothetical protein [Streptomyces sp. MMG1121]|uniref:hypothetical protein n=1 Tax=Streptomyces sp. MMG1121 TaxID=1415544 RepID=UPI0006AE5E0B|nr:hypothetical protein [Streptomyces sp. MMG1121]KOV62181.1 hypothetical protein ADK64_25155 [Streptomyces sp. MMG1121]